MRYKLFISTMLIFSIIFSICLTGCDLTSTVPTTEEASDLTTQAEDTTDKVDHIESTLELIFDGYMCDISVWEEDGFIDASFSLECTLSESNFYDFAEAFTKSVLALSADYGFGVSDINIDFKEQNMYTGEYEYITWDGDGVTGNYIHTAKEIVYTDVTLEDLHRICGSSGLHFNIYQ